MAEEKTESALIGVGGLPVQASRGGNGGVPFLRLGGGDGPTPLLRGGDGPVPFCFCGGDGPQPFRLLKAIRPLPPINGSTTVSVDGIVRMYYMLLFGYPATTIGVAEGVEWYLDYSGNAEVIKMLQKPEIEIVNRYNQVQGKLAYRVIESVWQPIIVVESWSPPVESQK